MSIEKVVSLLILPLVFCGLLIVARVNVYIYAYIIGLTVAYPGGGGGGCSGCLSTPLAIGANVIKNYTFVL